MPNSHQLGSDPHKRLIKSEKLGSAVPFGVGPNRRESWSDPRNHRTFNKYKAAFIFSVSRVYCLLMNVSDLSAVLAALADPARLRLLRLCRRGELTVKELTAATAMSQPRVSRHLRILVDAGVLRRFREAHWTYYRLRRDGESAELASAALQRLGAADPVLGADARRLDEVLAARAREFRAAAGGDSEEVLSPADWARLERALRELVRPVVTAGGLGRLLDVGTGAGRLLRLLGPDASGAIGVDRERAMRLAARSALRDAGLGHCSVRDADMYALPFDDASFDTVAFCRVLTGAHAPWDALAEAARVLAPNGQLLIIDLLPDGMPVDAWTDSLNAWCAGAACNLHTGMRLALTGGTAVLSLHRRGSVELARGAGASETPRPVRSVARPEAARILQSDLKQGTRQ